MLLYGSMPTNSYITSVQTWYVSDQGTPLSNKSCLGGYGNLGSSYEIDTRFEDMRLSVGGQT
jgi:hypothetical protein